MASHIHLNRAQAWALFNWLTNLPGFDARWRLMRRLDRSWKIKSLRGDVLEATTKLGRDHAVNLARQQVLNASARRAQERGEADEGSAEAAAKALYDLRIAEAAIKRQLVRPEVIDPDGDAEWLAIDDHDLEAVYKLTASLRCGPKPKDGKTQDDDTTTAGSPIGRPCEKCGQGGTALAGDYEVYGAICDALDMAYNCSRENGPACATCQANQARRQAAEAQPAAAEGSAA